MTTPIETAAPAPWYRGPYFLLTVMLVVSAILYPVVTAILGDNVLRIINTGLLVAGLYAVSGIRWIFRVLAVVIAPLLVANWFVDPTTPHALLDSATTIAVQLFLLAVMVVVFVNVVTSRRVTADAIFGSIAVYLLFGIVMAMTFQLVDALTPGAVISGMAEQASGQGDRFYDFVYFSFVTLTSVGYGDHAPLTSAARSIALFEGIVGQLYVAILVARLVGIHIAQN